MKWTFFPKIDKSCISRPFLVLQARLHVCFTKSGLYILCAPVCDMPTISGKMYCPRKLFRLKRKYSVRRKQFHFSRCILRQCKKYSQKKRPVLFPSEEEQVLLSCHTIPATLPRRISSLLLKLNPSKPNKESFFAALHRKDHSYHCAILMCSLRIKCYTAARHRSGRATPPHPPASPAGPQARANRASPQIHNPDRRSPEICCLP